MTLPVVSVMPQSDCWQRIGVWGDRSCPELPKVVHCHNCPVFSAAGRRFLNAPSPDAYLEEWTARLVAPIEETAADLQSVLVFRIGEEWLALRVHVLLEVANPLPIHTVPHRSGLLAGLVNIRGELLLCVRLAQFLGIFADEADGGAEDAALGKRGAATGNRLIVVQREGERWVFPVEEVDQVYRFSAGALQETPATLSRSLGRLTRGVFVWRERSIGYLDDARLFQVLRARIQ